MKDMNKNYYDAREMGKRIREIRKANGMKQFELAEKMYLSVESISRLENGKVVCMPEHIVNLCEIFRVSADYLYFGKNDNKMEMDMETKMDIKKDISLLLEGCSERELGKVREMIKVMLDK